MFAYCRNNPVSRRDISGTADVDTNFTENPIQDLMDHNEQFGGGGYASDKATSNGSNPCLNHSYGGSENTTQSNEPFLPIEYYLNKKAPPSNTPNSSYDNYKYNNRTGKFEKSTAYYDAAGRRIIRIDWTNHGRSDHGNPHLHITEYSAQYRDGITIRWD